MSRTPRTFVPSAFRLHARALALALPIALAALAGRTPASPNAPAPRAGPGSYQEKLRVADSVVRAQGGPNAGNAELFLSWNAPWGRRGASVAHTPRAADTSAVDTLYLAFRPGRASSGFNGFTGQLVFHAVGADTLGDWWRFEHGSANAGALTVEWGPEPLLPHPVWSVAGRGGVRLDHAPHGATLRMVYAVPDGQGAPLAPDSMYTLARVLLSHRRHLAGERQPVCIEWTYATLAFGLKDEPRVARGERFVAYAGPASIRDPFRAQRMAPWTPRKPSQ